RGVDGQSADEYAIHLEGEPPIAARPCEARHVSRSSREAGSYRGGRWCADAPHWGIPTFEDKVLQRAVAMTLEAVYEQDFLDCSYGFRPGRSAHQALARLRQEAMSLGGGWILEVDIKKFFDTLDHAHLREILRRRVRDGLLLRLIGKWLNAGV